MDTIGMIGVGLLGSAIAARLTAAGYGVLGYDLLPNRRRGAGSAQEVADKCRTIMLCLPTSDVVAEVLGALKLTPGTTIIDCTTGEPEAMAAMGVNLAKVSIDYLDATVLGSSRVVRNGAAVVMSGGRRPVFDAAAPLFKTFAGRAFYLGSYGAGARMKLVANLALGVRRRRSAVQDFRGARVLSGKLRRRSAHEAGGQPGARRSTPPLRCSRLSRGARSIW